MAVEINHNVHAILEENKRLRSIIAELRKKTTFKVYEENLALAMELETYRELSKGGDKSLKIEVEPSKEYKYSLIISQYYYSRHMFIIHHPENFLEQARAFTKELVEYKRTHLNRQDYLGDLDPKWTDGYKIKPRYNVNDEGDIYFIQGDYVNYLAGESRRYKEDSIRESRGFQKKAVTDAISKHHSYDKVKEILEKYFTIA